MNNQNASFQNISPSQADVWLKQSLFTRNRNINQGWVKHLEQQMELGRFKLNTIVFASFEGKTYLINGQHTLSAISNSHKGFNLPVVRVAVETSKDLAELCYHHDIGRARTLADAIKMMDYPAITGFSVTALKHLGAAIKLIGQDLEDSWGGKIALDDIINNIPDWVIELEEFFEAVEGASEFRDILLRKHVLPVVLISFREDSTRAAEFWGQVARDDMLPRLDPRKTLNNFLTEISFMNVENLMKKRLILKSKTVACIQAWNTYFSNKTMAKATLYKRSASENINPLVMKHTSFTGNKKASTLLLHPIARSPR